MVACMIFFSVLVLYLLVIFRANSLFIRLKFFQPLQYIYSPVSIIIPARNEEDNIGRCLESILAQDYPMEMMEIIVVDDQSDDRTVEIVNSFRDPRIKLIRISSDEKFGKK
mgnify:FL=1